MDKRIPVSYIAATWRNTLPIDDTANIGLGLETTNGEILRFSLDAESAKHIAETFAEYLADFQKRRCQRDKSLGMPSDAVSTPDGVENV